MGCNLSRTMQVKDCNLKCDENSPTECVNNTSVADTSNDLNQKTATTECKNSEPQLDTMPTLSPQQIAIIENTWKLLVENISRVGVITFVGLFETHPDVQQMFLPLRSILKEDLKYSKELRAHALRVMGYIQKVVARLKETDKCQQLLSDLGKRHVTYGAKVEYIDLVGQQFIYAIKPSLESVWSEAVEDAWNQLFAFINYHIKQRMITEMDT